MLQPSNNSLWNRTLSMLQKRWGLKSFRQVIIVFVVFGITGSLSVKIAAPILEAIGIHKSNLSLWVFWPLRIIIMFILYQILLVSIGFLFGQFQFFWGIEKKMLRRLGLKIGD